MAFKAVRQHRYNKLVSEGFSRAESSVLSQFLFKQPYIRLMRKERRALVRDTIRKAGIAYRDVPRLFKRFTLSKRGRRILKQVVESQYATFHWKDAFSMMRYYRQQAIELNLYFPPPKPKRHYSKGDVLAQKKRRKARQKTGRVTEWKQETNERGVVINYVRFNKDTGRFERMINK